MKKGDKQYGSQYWLRFAVNRAPAFLNAAVGPALELPPDDEIKWVSPLAPGYTEFRDDAFLRELGIDLPKVPLEDFWPDGGPVWDALAKTKTGKIILSEAKAHIPEINSPGSGATPRSLDRIAKSLNHTKAFLDAKPLVDWTRTFFQYTNRIAHLYLLRELNGLEAYLVNIYFVNENRLKGPSSVDEWKGALTLLKTHLGITQNALSTFMKDLFLDVNDLKEAVEQERAGDEK
jgi:hypothetical protein